MRERPILFTPENAQKCFNGTKTQTRRVVKFPAEPNHLGAWEPTTFGGPCVRTKQGDSVPEEVAIWHTRTGTVLTCPYGILGDRLWVRETWAIGISTGNSWHSEDGRIKAISEPQRYRRRYAANGTDGFFGKWRPSIFMPRWASRITLEITDVRVQRVQEISEEDARAEGVTIKSDAEIAARVAGDTPARMEFWALWKSIHGADSWVVNPWVWCITFKRVQS